MHLTLKREMPPVLFDLDGTLVDSWWGTYLAYRIAYRRVEAREYSIGEWTHDEAHDVAHPAGVRAEKGVAYAALPPHVRCRPTTLLRALLDRPTPSARWGVFTRSWVDAAVVKLEDVGVERERLVAYGVEKTESNFRELRARGVTTIIDDKCTATHVARLAGLEALEAPLRIRGLMSAAERAEVTRARTYLREVPSMDGPCLVGPAGDWPRLMRLFEEEL